MKKVVTISSPRMDYLLGPAVYRRYSNHIFGWNIFITSAVFYLLAPFLFPEIPYFEYVVYIFKNETRYIEDLNFFAFYFKSAIAFSVSFFISLKVSAVITKPVNRVKLIEGNFLDDSAEVFKNIANDFKGSNQENNIKLIEKNEADINSSKPPFKKLSKIVNDIFIPSSILELSFIIRGEAGSGKTVFADRIIKETIKSGHKVVLHNIKGDEFKKLNGFCSFYLIEPWNQNGGYAINFLALLARKKEEDRNAYIYSFVKSFLGKSSKQDAFFDGSAVEVLFAIVKKVVEDEMKKPAYKAGLIDIVNLWVSFQAKTEEKEIDLTNPLSMKKAMDNKIESLEKIKQILIEKNPTQADLIDSNNAKTSLCILATCTKTIKKFEVLAKFWGNREQTKSLDLVKWLATKKDRPVLMLSNSNLYVAEAEAYISAVVNLLTMFVINTEYEPVSELHFILDEFVQLSSIDLKQFMKLPDVGRGKLVRTKVIFQRTSQIKEVFDVDPASFSGAFQNKIWARMSTDDFSILNAELGKQKVDITKSSANHNKDGMSSNTSTETKLEDVCNPAELQKELGPVKDFQDKFLGVRILMNFSQFRRISIATFPPVDFPKTKAKRYKFKSTAGNSPSLPAGSQTAEDREQVEPQFLDIDVTETVLASTTVDHQEHGQEHPEEPLGGVLNHAATPEPIAIALQVAELIEHMEGKNENKNIVQVNTSTITDEKKELMKALLNKNKKKNKEMEL